MKTTYSYFTYHHMNPDFKEVEKNIAKAIEDKDWEAFSALYKKWHTGNNDFEYMYDHITVYIERSETDWEVKDIPLTQENFMLIQGYDCECG